MGKTRRWLDTDVGQNLPKAPSEFDYEMRNVNAIDYSVILTWMACMNESFPKTFWKCPLRLFTFAYPMENSLAIERKLKQYLSRIRISAAISVIELEDAVITPHVLEKTLEVRMT